MNSFKSYRGFLEKSQRFFAICKKVLIPDIVLNLIMHSFFDVIISQTCRHLMFITISLLIYILLPIALIAFALFVFSSDNMAIQIFMFLNGDLLFLVFFVLFWRKLYEELNEWYPKAISFIYNANFEEVFNGCNSIPLMVFNWLTFVCACYILWISTEDSSDAQLILMLIIIWLCLIGLYFTSFKPASQMIMVGFVYLIIVLNGIYNNPEKFPNSPLIQQQSPIVQTSANYYGGNFVYPTLTNCNSYIQCYGIDNYSTLEYNQNNTLNNGELTKVFLPDAIALKMGSKFAAKALASSFKVATKATAKSVSKVVKVAAKPLLRAIKPAKVSIKGALKKPLKLVRELKSKVTAKVTANFAKSKANFSKNMANSKARFKANISKSQAQIKKSRQMASKNFKQAKDRMLALGKKAKNWRESVKRMGFGTAKSIKPVMNVKRFNFFKQQTLAETNYLKNLSPNAKRQLAIKDKEAKKLTQQTLDEKANDVFTISKENSKIEGYTAETSKGEHFKKHKDEFLNADGSYKYNNAQEYTNGALKLFNNPSKNVLTIKKRNKDISRYNPDTHELVTINKDQKIKSYFRVFPKDTQLNPHGYKTEDYNSAKEYFYGIKKN
jgi:hypothetical protein